MCHPGRRLSIILRGLRVILLNAFALRIEQAEIGLRRGIALRCGLVIPGGGLRKILLHAFALGVKLAKFALRAGIALVGRLAIPIRRLREIFGDASAKLIWRERG